MPFVSTHDELSSTQHEQYCTNAGHQTQKQTLLQSTNFNPTSITLDPFRGVMYWADWSSVYPEKGRIDMAQMDGNNRQIFLNANVHWPSGLAIDYVENRLYWCDKHLKRIQSVDFFGTNNCTESSCPEFCFPTPNGAVCACSDGYQSINDTCIKQKNFTLPSNCPRDFFQCHHGRRCIPNSYLCDGIDNCGDSSDELSDVGGPCQNVSCGENQLKCDKTTCIAKHWDCLDGTDEDPSFCAKICDESEFKCKNSWRCIPSIWRCDNVIDCGPNDDSDETDCSVSTCDVNEFTCKYGQCITASFYCDSIPDCEDGSDEINCLVCDSTKQLACKDLNECLPSTTHCDGKKDCPDGSDERNCPPKVDCEPNEFACGNFECIPKVDQLCDERNDCEDGSDEGLRCGDMLCEHSFVCSHDCHNAPEGVICTCPPHLHLQADRTHCLETHPCEAWGVCSQNCIRRGSRYKCTCKDGYVIQEDGFTCKSVDKGRPYNYVYWTDWRTNSVVRANKWTGGDVRVIQRTLTQPFDIKIMHPSRQPRDVPNPCGDNNGGCSHLCLIHMNQTYRCDCPHVMKLSADNKTCVDGTKEHVLLSNDVGKPNAIALDPAKGYLVWAAGTRLEIATLDGQNRRLLLDNLVDVSSVALDSKNEMIYFCDAGSNSIEKNSPQPSIKNDTMLKNAIGLSFSYKHQRLFYSDIQKGSINVVYFNGSDHRVIVERQGSVEGLAYEKVHNALYWINLTDSMTNASVVETIVRLRVQDKPRGIAIDSCGARIYWTNWNSYQPSIERAFLSGYRREAIIKTDIKMPNAIALDHVAQKLYWGDARLDKIERCEYDGSNRIVLARVTPQHPFALAVYGDFIYWTDWMLHAVIRADKYTGRCIPLTWVCDGEDDCPDSLDEHAVQGCVSDSCGEDQFRCNDGKCIHKLYFCDGDKDCRDGSDENQECYRACATGQFTCQNSKCISESLKCNGKDDCGDGSDEGINECLATPSPCSQKCVDKPVGFECQCDLGYQMSPKDQRYCNDIDECLEKPCSQICRNTRGSYHCSCHRDYILQFNKKSCRANSTIKYGYQFKAPYILVLI
ncbi:hypothetical protein NQ317_010540 [Molorchus minor]|uniref:EGF-like domain-containing protein n=1 Tax=Molorchus minor TaxID=1323400 RepID=A0ABQ9JAZ1_9CUCU|nr:hypothetical protein NQ317_010540 [Molorchus minor]